MITRAHNGVRLGMKAVSDGQWVYERVYRANIACEVDVYNIALCV
jgi:hypothetical protein